MLQISCQIPIKTQHNKRIELQQQKCTLELPLLLKSIQRQLSAVSGVRRIEIDDDLYENRGNLAINGSVTWIIGKGKGLFYNAPGATIVVAGKLVIEARRIINISATLAAHGGMTLRAKKSLENDFGTIADDAGVLAITASLQNCGGRILSKSGKVQWLTTSGGLGNNRCGMIFAAKKFSIAIHGAISARLGAPILKNRGGAIYSFSELIELPPIKFDNKGGILFGMQGALACESIDNRSGGMLLFALDSRISVKSCFQNRHGLLASEGVLTLKDGLWINTGGVIQSKSGIKVGVTSWSDYGKGYVISTCGPIAIATRRNLRLTGYAEALGIKLTSEEGIISAPNAHLTAGNKPLIIESKSYSIEIWHAVAHAEKVSLLAKTSIQMAGITLIAAAEVSVTSEQGSIDAKNSAISTAKGSLHFKAPHSIVDLDGSTISTAGKLLVEDKYGEMERAKVTAGSGFDHRGDHFSGKSTKIEVKKGDVTFGSQESGKTLFLDDMHYNAKEGSIALAASSWICDSNSHADTKKISRKSRDIAINDVHDKAGSIDNSATKSLSQSSYEAIAKTKIALNSGGTSYLTGNDLTAPSVVVTVKKLWMESSAADFTDMQMHADSAYIDKMTGSGKSVKVKTGTIELSGSQLAIDKAVWDSSSAFVASGNTLRGSTVLKSRSFQHISHNTFVDSDVKVASSESNVSLVSNTIVRGGDFTTATPQGTTYATNLQGDLDTIYTVGQTIFLEQSTLSLRSASSLRSAKALLHRMTIYSRGKVEVDARETLVVMNSLFQVDSALAFSSAGTAAMQAVIAHSADTLTFQAAHGSITRCALSSDAKNLSTTFDRQGQIVLSQLIAGHSQTLSSRGAVEIVDSELAAPTLQIAVSSLTCVKALLDGGEAVSIEGREAHLRATHLASKGEVTVDVEELVVQDSSFSGTAISLAAAAELFLEKSAVKSETLSMSGGNLVGSHNQIESKSWQIRSEKALFSHTEAAEGLETLLIETQSGAALPDSTLHGSTKIDNKSGLVDLARSVLLGTLQIDNGGDLLVTALQQQGDFLKIRSSGSLLADSLQVFVDKEIDVTIGQEALLSAALLHSNHGPITVLANTLSAAKMRLHSGAFAQISAKKPSDLSQVTLIAEELLSLLFGDSVNLDESRMKALSIHQIAPKGISAKKSIAIAEQEIVQRADSGDIHIEASQMQAGSSFTRDAAGLIDHRNGVTIAQEHRVHATHFDNFNGTVVGDFSFDVVSINQEHGSFFLGSHASQISAKTMTTDSESFFEGPGSLAITLFDEGFVRSYGTVHVGSLSMQTSAPLQLFQKITVRDSAKFTAAWIMNYGEIFSYGAVEVNQRLYHPLHKVVALGLLQQSVDGPIVLQEAMQTSGALALVSRSGNIVVLAPLTVAGDLSLQSSGGDIELYKRVAAAGKGRLQAAGPILLAHTQVYFRNGLDAALSNSFTLLASDLDVAGDVRISGGPLGGQLQLLSVVHPYGHASQSFPQIPSNMRVDGNFTLDASLLNKGSLLAVTGDAALRGRVELINDTHIHRYTVEVGSCPRRICGINTGKKKRLYAQVEQIVLDGNPARVEVGTTLQLGMPGQLASSLKNEGIIIAHRIQGTVSSLHNGLFSCRGRAPQNILGQIRSLESTDLKVEGLLHNRGVIQGGNSLTLRVGSLIKERRMTMETTQVARIRSWGRVKAVGAQEGEVGPAELMSGDEVLITIEQSGRSSGGQIQAGSSLQIQGKGSYVHEAVKVEKIVRLNPGRWSRAPTHTTHTSFIASQAHSAGTMALDFLGNLNIFASSFASWGAMTVCAAEIAMSTGFGANLVMSKAGVIARKRLFEIIQQQSEILSVAGPLLVEARAGSFVAKGGRVGSFGSSATVKARDNITFSAASLTAENKVRSTSISPTTFSHNVTSYNVSGVSLPEFFSGTNALLAAGKVFAGDGFQLLVGNDLIAVAKEIRLRKYSVPRYWSNQGESIGIKFFFSEVIDAAVMGTPFSSALAATLLRDPAISSLYSLVQARDGAEYAANSLMAMAHTWNGAVTLAHAHNEGNLFSTVANRFGFRDFSIRFGSYEGESTWSDTYATKISVGGDLLFLADSQHFSDVQGHIGRDAELRGKELIWDAQAEEVSQESSSGGITFGVGPSGLSLGMDASENNSQGKSHQNSHFHIGRTLSIPAADSVVLHGAVLDAEEVRVKAKKVDIASPVNQFLQNHWSASFSTTGQVSYSAGNSRQEAIQEPSVIRARSGGGSVIEADEVDIAGGVIDGIVVKADQVRGRDIHHSSTSSGFSLSLDLKAIANTAKGTPSQGIQSLGSFDFHQQKQKSVTRATITSADSRRYPAINSERSRTQESDKAKKAHFIAPLLAINPALIQHEAHEIQKAVAPAQTVTRIQAVAALSARIQLPSSQQPKLQAPKKAEEAKKPAKKVEKQSALKKSRGAIEALENPDHSYFLRGDFSPETDAPDDPVQFYSLQGQDFSPTHPSVLSLAWNVWERKSTKDVMGNARAIAMVDHAIGVGVAKIVKFVPEATSAVCHSHPLLESGCRKVEEHFEEKKELIQQFGSIVKIGANAVKRDFRRACDNNPKLEQGRLIVQTIYAAAARGLKSGRDYVAPYAKALAANHIVRNEQLGIARKETEQFHKDLQSVALAALAFLRLPVVASAGSKPGTSIVLWKAPKIGPSTAGGVKVLSEQRLLPKPPSFILLPPPSRALPVPAPALVPSKHFIKKGKPPQKGEIYLVDLDSTKDISGKKFTPSIVISNNNGNALTNKVIIAPLSFESAAPLPYEVATSAMKEPSTILLNQLRCIDKSRLEKKLAKVDAATRLKVENVLKRVLLPKRHVVGGGAEMPPRPLLQRGEIYWVDFTSTAIGSEIMKQRPALVISDTYLSDKVIVAPISTKVKPCRWFEVEMMLEGRAARILPYNAREIDPKFIKGKMGKAKGETLRQVAEVIKMLLFRNEM